MKDKFSGHQTFAFRHGWLEKGVKFVTAHGVFSQDDAIVGLGVGKNMVESIRYWCQMTGVITVANQKDGTDQVTGFAHHLLDDAGWDPFLEDDASLWLLHWQLATNQEWFTAGTALFSSLHKPDRRSRGVPPC